MIDLELLRQKPEEIKALMRKKDPSFDGEKLYQLDEKLRHLKLEVETLRHQKNELAKQGQKTVTPELREQARALSQDLKQKEQDLECVQAEFKEIYLYCPNILLSDIPEGSKEENKVVKVWGKKPDFAFTPKNHAELGALNNWFDFEAATRMTGSNFALYKGDSVKLVYSLMMFMLNNNMRHGYSPVLPPYLINYKALEGASNFPRFKDEVYSVPADDLYLTPTSEVNLTSMYRDHIFAAQDLPVRMTAWTSCFRREAGGYGAHERGLIRIHQFEKAELYTITEPQHAQQEQERMLACAESILQALGLHYQVSLLAAQDCSFASAKTYDIEVWMPGQGVYKEVSSASNCTDFQARRSEIRYRSVPGAKTQLVYTLNASSLALPRLMVALMETYQKEDGSIELPDILKSVTVGL
ncbi:serine--tRNA ligase [Candidatus Dependentiae bacterium]|nr:serine--tRNA ligase [Candidatus Dependentiae bacterium]